MPFCVQGRRKADQRGRCYPRELRSNVRWQVIRLSNMLWRRLATSDKEAFKGWTVDITSVLTASAALASLSLLWNTALPADEGACGQIRSACQAAGFVPGGAEGKWEGSVDLLRPVDLESLRGCAHAVALPDIRTVGPAEPISTGKSAAGM